MSKDKASAPVTDMEAQERSIVTANAEPPARQRAAAVSKPAGPKRFIRQQVCLTVLSALVAGHKQGHCQPLMAAQHTGLAPGLHCHERLGSSPHSGSISLPCCCLDKLRGMQVPDDILHNEDLNKAISVLPANYNFEVGDSSPRFVHQLINATIRSSFVAHSVFMLLCADPQNSMASTPGSC